MFFFLVKKKLAFTLFDLMMNSQKFGAIKKTQLNVCILLVMDEKELCSGVSRLQGKYLTSVTLTVLNRNNCQIDRSQNLKFPPIYYILSTTVNI